ncbi:hypothetical protein JCM19235_1235 [Vibrio maritimus]|uniref:Tip attachment protein J HDII-ins2 domain-containing protein n=1 Tax=Vibrio maritimus TaxID=990268 RepID=A0A090S8T9_9VIBR|nr:hypothetical protein JCM19235_1235 [Vibrio maritimus]
MSDGRYQNYYTASEDGRWFSHGDLVTEDGQTSVRKNHSTDDDGNEVYSYNGALPILKVEPTSYDYGDLYCDGVKVGTYHDFHLVNKFVASYNGSGMDYGSKAGQLVIMTGDSSSSNTRFSFESPSVVPGRYEIRARRTSAQNSSAQVQDSIFWNEITEIQDVSIAYNFTALLAIKIKVTDQISNIPTITIEHQGRSFECGMTWQRFGFQVRVVKIWAWADLLSLITRSRPMVSLATLRMQRKPQAIRKSAVTRCLVLLRFLCRLTCLSLPIARCTQTGSINMRTCMGGMGRSDKHSLRCRHSSITIGLLCVQGMGETL